MIAVIIAGGSGTRLWPLSQPHYPKHLLRLTGENSLLQNTYERIKDLATAVYVVPEASHAAEVSLQLPGLEAECILAEPARRGTASCIVLALSQIAKKYPDETVVFLHADHHIKNTAGFVTALKAAAKASEQQKSITLIGLNPTYPATGFGYIKTGSERMQVEGLGVKEVEGFVEKPDFETAQHYLNDGSYLWNMGLFAAPIPVFTSAMKKFAPDLFKAYQGLLEAEDWLEVEKRYLKLKSQPIDTALIEKDLETLVVPGEFDWSDIGSFLDLHKVIKEKDTNALKGEVYQLDCTDSMIHGSTKPIVAVGLEGIVVVDTPEGLLVCSKEQSQKVGDIVKELQKRKS